MDINLGSSPVDFFGSKKKIPSSLPPPKKTAATASYYIYHLYIYMDTNFPYVHFFNKSRFLCLKVVGESRCRRSTESTFEVTFAAGTVLDLAGNDLGALDTSASWLLGTLQHNHIKSYKLTNSSVGESVILSCSRVIILNGDFFRW